MLVLFTYTPCVDALRTKEINVFQLFCIIVLLYGTCKTIAGSDAGGIHATQSSHVAFCDISGASLENRIIGETASAWSGHRNSTITAVTAVHRVMEKMVGFMACYVVHVDKTQAAYIHTREIQEARGREGEHK